EVGAGAEDGAFVAEDADPDLVVGLGLVDGRLDALGDVTVHRVAGLGPVDGDEGDVAPLLVFDHGPTLLRRVLATTIACSACTALKPAADPADVAAVAGVWRLRSLALLLGGPVVVLLVLRAAPRLDVAWFSAQ